MSDSRAIGVFDSGIGGLTIASSIAKLLPNEQIIYFGDTLHLPYGDKDQNTVLDYSKKITNYLIENQNCKCIVIACNTASAASYIYLRDNYKGQVPIINVIDPIVEDVINDKSIKKVGIIGTKTTIDSGIYQEKLTRRKSILEYVTLPTPKLAPMIEESFYQSRVDESMIHSYLKDPILSNIDGLILACTHYPLIKKEINNFYGGQVKLIDSTSVVADKLKDILEKENLLSSEKEKENKYYVSHYTESFEKTTEIFFGEKIKLEENNIFE